MLMYTSSFWGKLSWQHHLHMKRHGKDTVSLTYLCEISKVDHRALSPNCYLDKEAHHITNEFSFEEKDPFQQ